MKFLHFITKPYSIGILEPLIQEIEKTLQGESLIYIPQKYCSLVNEGIKYTTSVRKAIDYNPDIVFAPGNMMHYKIPGIKVQVFHGLCEEKKGHYKINGLFDLYCTSGPLITKKFQTKAKKLKYFSVKETGWIKIDKLLEEFDKNAILQKMGIPPKKKIILYTPTFSPRFKSSEKILPVIEHMPKDDEIWILKFHDLMDREEMAKFKKLPEENFRIYQNPDNTELLQIADVLISDTSSIVYEFMLLDKPVITIDASVRVDKGINIANINKLRQAVDRSLKNPAEFSENRRKYLKQIHPYYDKENSKRVLDAATDFLCDTAHRPQKKKPLNLLRKYKITKKFRI